MNTHTRNGFMTRFAAVLMVAMVLLSAVSFGHQTMTGHGVASFAPVVEAKADVFDDFVVEKNDANGDKTISLGTPAEDDDAIEVGDLVGKAKGLAQVALGVCAVLAIVSLIFNIAKMAMSSTNEANRKKAQTGILYSGIALALFGSLTAVTGFFWGFLGGI